MSKRKKREPHWHSVARRCAQTARLILPPANAREELASRLAMHPAFLELLFFTKDRERSPEDLGTVLEQVAKELSVPIEDVHVALGDVAEDMQMLEEWL